MNIYWYEQIKAFHSLLRSYELLSTFDESYYLLSDVQKMDIAKWNAVIWDKINELSKELEK